MIGQILNDFIFGKPCAMELLMIERSKQWKTHEHDPRNNQGVLWHWSDFQKHGFADELLKGDLADARKHGIIFFNEYFVPTTTEELARGYEVALGIIEDDSWDEELHEFDFKKQIVGNPYPGTPENIFVYKFWTDPNAIIVRVRFKFSRGTYDKIEIIYEDE